jgi:hypothetical protein
MPKRKFFIGSKICSKGEKRISDFLLQYNITHKKEQTFATCLSKKGNPLRFDFYLSDYNILIEYQGQHHYKPINKYRRAKTVHNQTVIHDNIKKEFIGLHNLELIEIHYSDYEKIEIILKEKLNLI